MQGWGLVEKRREEKRGEKKREGEEGERDERGVLARSGRSKCERGLDVCFECGKQGIESLPRHASNNVGVLQAQAPGVMRSALGLAGRSQHIPTSSDGKFDLRIGFRCGST